MWIRMGHAEGNPGHDVMLDTDHLIDTQRIMVVTGGTGSGKTCLLRSIAQQLDTRTPTVVVDGPWAVRDPWPARFDRRPARDAAHLMEHALSAAYEHDEPSAVLVDDLALRSDKDGHQFFAQLAGVAAERRTFVVIATHDISRLVVPAVTRMPLNVALGTSWLGSGYASSAAQVAGAAQAVGRMWKGPITLNRTGATPDEDEYGPGWGSMFPLREVDGERTLLRGPVAVHQGMFVELPRWDGWAAQ